MAPDVGGSLVTIMHIIMLFAILKRAIKLVTCEGGSTLTKYV